MKQHFAAKLTLSALTILLAIAPVPFEKWAWSRIGFGLLGLVGVASTKSKIDEEAEEQRVLDVYEFEQKQYEKELAGMQQGLALEAARQQEAVRFGLQTKVMAADYQGAFVTLMEDKHPYYLDALEAQQKAALQAQERAYSVEGGTAARVGEAMEIGAIGSEGCANGSEAQSSPVEMQDKGQRLLQRLRKSDMSILVVGSTGAGKSHTLSAYLEFLYQDFADADVWVISRKNDSFCGLREAGRVIRFNSLDPVDALDKLREIHAIFQERTEVLEEDRVKLSTIRLILEDWSSICAILKKNKLIWNEVQIILSDIVTVGRELNIALFILAQSAILESLGLVSDANLRTCLVIVAQGLESINNKGEKQGDYNLVQLILRNAYIIPSDEDRKFLTNELSNSIAESRRMEQPVFLCTGGEAFVGLLPKITKATLPVGRQSNRAIQSAPLAESSQKIAYTDTQRQQLDNLYKGSSIANQLRNEMTPEEIDELIEGLRNGVDTSGDTPDSFLTPKTASKTNQTSELVLGKDSRRIWDVSDFRKNLPDRQEEVMFSELDAYFRETSRSPSEIIKRAWKLSNGEVYGSIGKPCFVYLAIKYGDDELKNSSKVAKLISEYLAFVDDVEEE